MGDKLFKEGIRNFPDDAGNKDLASTPTREGPWPHF